MCASRDTLKETQCHAELRGGASQIRCATRKGGGMNRNLRAEQSDE